MKEETVSYYRSGFAEKLKKDEELRFAYQSNIAMLLHDRYGITNWDKRNNAANDIIKLIFDIDVDVIKFGD